MSKKILSKQLDPSLKNRIWLIGNLQKLANKALKVRNYYAYSILMAIKLDMLGTGKLLRAYKKSGGQ